MKADVVKKNWEIMMVFRSEPDCCGGHDDTFVSHTTIHYTLENITRLRQVTVPVGLEIDLDVVGQHPDGKRVPRVISVKIDDHLYEGTELEAKLKNNATLFEADAHIVGNRPIAVHLELEEIVRVPDTSSWVTTSCTEDAVVTISSTVRGLLFDVTALHPEAASLTVRSPGKSWEFAGGAAALSGLSGKHQEASRLQQSESADCAPYRADYARRAKRDLSKKKGGRRRRPPSLRVLLPRRP